MTKPEATEGLPRWVKVFGLVALFLIIAFVVLHVSGIAPHGHG